MDLTHPARLAALAAALIPLVLHLWRRHRGNRVRVGSIRHLATSSVARRFSLHLAEPWLLLLRLAVVVALATAIAGPLAKIEARPRNLAIVDPGVGAPAGILLDSLAAAGDEIQRPATGDLWSLAREADATLPPGSRLTLVADRWAILVGSRPAISALPALRIVEPNPERDAVPAGQRPASNRHHFDIVARPDQQELSRYLTAAVKATADIFGDSITVETVERAGHNGGNGEPTTVFMIDSVRIEALQADSSAAHSTLIAFEDGPLEPGERLLASPPALAPIRLIGRRAGGRSVLRVSGAGPLGDLALSGRLPSVVAMVWPRTDELAYPGIHSEQQILPRIAHDGDRGPRGMPLGRILVAVAAGLFVAERLVSLRRHSADLR